jgi:CheY-like chemotaxis protein
VQECTTVPAALQHLTFSSFDALLLDLETDAQATLGTIEHVRGGHYACDAQVPVAVSTTGCNLELALQLKRLNVQHILVKPYKVKTVLAAIDRLFPFTDAFAPPRREYTHTA